MKNGVKEIYNSYTTKKDIVLRDTKKNKQNSPRSRKKQRKREKDKRCLTFGSHNKNNKFNIASHNQYK